MYSNQEKVLKKYSKYKYTKPKIKYSTLCSIEGFQLTNVQKFLGEYIKTQKRILLYHGIGSGKTITIIQIISKNIKKLNLGFLILINLTFLRLYFMIKAMKQNIII